MLNQLKKNISSDPIATEIIREKLQSIPDLIEADLTRTAFSPMIYEYKDYSVGLVDAEGRIIALARHGLPMFTASQIGCAVRDGLAVYGEGGIEPGDIIVTNHAATLGQHLNNIVMYTPVFDAGDLLVAYMAIIVHWVDIGGRYPGSCAGTDTTELLQEGLQLRSIKIHRRGEAVDDVYRIIQYNTRVPEILLGDIAAQVTGCIKGRELFRELLDRHSTDVLMQAIESIWDSSEKAARAAVFAIPNGTYEMSSYLDNDGVEMDRRIPINIKVLVEDDEFTVDFSDIGEQVRGPFNSGRYGGAETAARIAFKYLFTPDEAPNEGGFAPVKIIIPPGKFLSAGENAPMGKYSSTLPTVTDTIIAAMAPVMPDRVAAAHHASWGVMNSSGKNPKTGLYFNYFDTAHGGWGGSSRGDGVGPFKTLMHADNKDIPVEVQEALYPVRIERHEWRTDSAGPGYNRGGSGVTKSYLALSPFVTNLSFERSGCVPWGLFGGMPGASGHVEIARADGENRITHKESNIEFEAGDRFHIQSGGGGGFGMASERSPDRVELDIEEGQVSRQRAREDYGVVITQDGVVDVSATELCRSRFPSASDTWRGKVKAIVGAIVAVMAFLLFATGDRAEAQTYPERAIRLVVPFTAGGGTDITARILAQKLSESLGQTVLVENRTGAGGSIGTNFVAKSPPDGYTLLFTHTGHVVLPSLAQVPWDPIKDFAPVARIVSWPLVLVVSPSLHADSLAELIKLAKSKPGSLNYGTGGIGTPPHLAMELLKSITGIDLVHVPYLGNAPLTAALMGNQIQVLLDTMTGPLESVRSGAFKALAVTGKSRSPLLPEVPTMTESAVPGFSFEGWTGVLAPVGTPKSIIDKLNAEFAKALLVPEVANRFITLGYEPASNSADEFGAIVSSDVDRYAKIIKEAGIKAN